MPGSGACNAPRMPRTRHVLRATGLAAMLVLGAGGCGASDGADRAQAKEAAAGAQAARGVRLVKLGDFASPLYVTSPPGDASRVFVVEQAGRIWIVKNGKRLEQPFLDISSQISAGGERGLLSLAFARGSIRRILPSSVFRLWPFPRRPCWSPPPPPSPTPM